MSRRLPTTMRRPVSGAWTSLKLAATHSRRPARGSGVVLGGDAAQAAHPHPPAGVGVLALVEAGRDPQPAPVPVSDRSDEAALITANELPKCVAGLAVR